MRAFGETRGVEVEQAHPLDLVDRGAASAR